MTETIEGLNTFETADDLIWYIEIKREAPRALILYTHMIQFAYLADLDLSKIRRSELLINNNFVSIRSYNKEHIEKLLLNARKRLEDNLIPDDWKDRFVAFFENKDTENVVHLDNHKH